MTLHILIGNPYKILSIMRKSLLALTLILFAFSQLGMAQEYHPKHSEQDNLKVPEGWEVRLDNPEKNASIGDDPDKHDIYFVNMSPGWHITTGPRAIFYRPDVKVEGNYSVSTTIHLFDTKGRNEAFGLFFGGQNLQESNQSYTYYLLRNSGEYLIKKRIGDGTEVIKGWTEAPAMKTYQDTTETSVSNTLSVKVGDTSVSFFINGKKVEELPKEGIDTEGIAGLRVNHVLNLHIEKLDVSKN